MQIFLEFCSAESVGSVELPGKPKIQGSFHPANRLFGLLISGYESSAESQLGEQVQTDCGICIRDCPGWPLDQRPLLLRARARKERARKGQSQIGYPAHNRLLLGY